MHRTRSWQEHDRAALRASRDGAARVAGGGLRGGGGGGGVFPGAADGRGAALSERERLERQRERKRNDRYAGAYSVTERSQVS